MTHTASIRLEDGKLFIGFSSPTWGDRSGAEWPATEKGLADCKQALKNDGLVCADDFGAIDKMRLPTEADYDEVKITGDGDQ